ncbi:hypothetical protein ASF19_20255 [Acidovorax sp. Leaf84]|uniref:hypothetical protein n=1 Tax=Acidovorax sp. Leaf84 TaxID=1736240 RepID=UPI0006F8C9C8|nr:hypothetical protein [Acidovorax sp. Leaf84]KQO38109.1 hypothetical protein ASF19_20255 [Acidovorax sp. Leaf84]
MKSGIQIEALMLVLQTIVDGHPRPALVLAQVDGLIAEMQVNAENSPQLQAADPLREAVEQIKANLF